MPLTNLNSLTADRWVRIAERVGKASKPISITKDVTMGNASWEYVTCEDGMWVEEAAFTNPCDADFWWHAKGDMSALLDEVFILSAQLEEAISGRRDS